MPAETASNIGSLSVQESYAHCRRIAKERAKNFYYSFLLLEKPKRDAMCALYAFMRYCDDLSDDPGTNDQVKRQQSISLWRLELERSLNGHPAANPLWPAFCDTVQRYAIPHRFFHEMIDGVTSDIEPRQIPTYEELYQYCYRVASVVGMAIIHIFGFNSVRALLLAEKCGIAFQLTNILRDVREDAEMGRVYLPLEDLQHFSIPVEQLRSGQENEDFRRLMRFEARRARACYDESAALDELIDRKSRRSLWALRQIYLRLLTKIERSGYSVLSRRIQVSKPAKIGILLAAFLR